MVTKLDRANRYWEDANEGDEVPGFELPLTPTEIVLQVFGSQDFYQVHHDQGFARATVIRTSSSTPPSRQPASAVS